MARRKSKSSPPNTATKTPAPAVDRPSAGRARTLILLAGVSAVCALLAVFQWMELLLVEAGQETVCELNEVFNCASVWSAPAAKWWQATTGVPVAGWGLLWSLLAFAASLWAMHGYLLQADARRPVASVQLVAVAGVATSVLLALYSLSLGQVCLTCWTTYALVGLYAGLAATLTDVVRPSTAQQPAYTSAAMALGGAALVGYLGLLIPGASTPLPGAEDTPSLAVPAPAASPDSNVVAEYLRTLTPAVQRKVAEGLEAYRTETRPTLPPLTARPFTGRANAPVRMTDFSDMRCPHCARLAETMVTLVEQLPAEQYRLESRYFPLDAECNPRLDPRFTDGSHVRCTAAKALVCSQADANYEAVRMRLFKEQRNLTLDLVRSAVVEMTAMSVEDLDACLSSPETAAKLAEDIAYAGQFDIRGTPMVVMNGRKVLAFGPLLMALVLAEGDPSHPGFGMLAELAQSSEPR